MQYASVSNRVFRRYVVGDVVAILLFVVIGEVQHGHPVTRAAVTCLPFLVGWALAAYAVGAYTSSTGASLRANLGTVVVGWALADVVGQVVRLAAGALGLLSDVDAAPVEVALFAVVTYLFGVLFLGIWRSVAWFVTAE